MSIVGDGIGKEVRARAGALARGRGAHLRQEQRLQASLVLAAAVSAGDGG